MRFSRDKDVNRLVCELVREGWRYRRGGKHGKLFSPETTGFLTIPGSPSDHRTLRNMRSDVQKLRAKSPQL
jgi:predicted RNase H-like nuclease